MAVKELHLNLIKMTNWSGYDKKNNSNKRPHAYGRGKPANCLPAHGIDPQKVQFPAQIYHGRTLRSLQQFKTLACTKNA